MSKNRSKSSKNFLMITSTFMILVIVIIISAIVGKEFSLMDKEHVEYNQVLKVPNKDLIDLRKREFNTLNSYAVVDKEANIYRIPINRAMELMAE